MVKTTFSALITTIAVHNSSRSNKMWPEFENIRQRIPSGRALPTL